MPQGNRATPTGSGRRVGDLSLVWSEQTGSKGLNRAANRHQLMTSQDGPPSRWRYVWFVGLSARPSRPSAGCCCRFAVFRYRQAVRGAGGTDSGLDQADFGLIRPAPAAAAGLRAGSGGRAPSRSFGRAWASAQLRADTGHRPPFGRTRAFAQLRAHPAGSGGGGRGLRPPSGGRARWAAIRCGRYDPLAVGPIRRPQREVNPSVSIRPRPKASTRFQRPGRSSSSRWPIRFGSAGSTMR